LAFTGEHSPLNASPNHPGRFVQLRSPCELARLWPANQSSAPRNRTCFLGCVLSRASSSTPKTAALRFLTRQAKDCSAMVLRCISAVPAPIVAPRECKYPIADDVAHRGQASGAWPSIIEQATLATMIQRGDLEHHLRAMRRCYRRRRDTLVEALSETLALSIGGAAAGLHLIAWPPEGTDVNAIAAQAREQGIALDTLHYRCGCNHPALRRCCSATPPSLNTPCVKPCDTGSLARSRTNAACSQTPTVRQVSVVACGSATTLQAV
jgi:hypothetical protein